MTILFFTRLFWPHLGGVEKHVENISRELIKLGYQVTIVTEQYDNRLKQVEKRKSIKIYRIPVWDVSEKAKKWRIWRWLWQHRDLIQAADIIHVHDVFFWYLPFRFLFPGKPVFITLHGYETQFPPSKSAIFQKRLAAKLTAGNICVGDYLGKWYGIKPTLITYGASDIKPLSFPKKPHILVLGRLSQDNNLDIILPALKHTHIPVTFVGDGPYRKQAEGIGPVTGFIADITPYLRQVNIVIASSYLSILDALAAGRTVISVYSNPLKQDYLLSLDCKKIPTWDKIGQLYLQLWHQKLPTVPST